jgi:hypothetical protein
MTMDADHGETNPDTTAQAGPGSPGRELTPGRRVDKPVDLACRPRRAHVGLDVARAMQMRIPRIWSRAAG